MLDMAPPVTSEFLFAPVGHRYLDRFDLAGARSDADSSFVGALARLRQAGLDAAITKQEPLRIVGGRRGRTVGAIKVYDEGFVISCEPDGSFFGGVAGPGNTSERICAASLGQAVDFVVDVYRRRSEPTR